MILEALLTGIFFEPGADIPMYGIKENIQRAEIHRNVNNVGTSNFQTYLSDPQPEPLLQIKGPGIFEQYSVQKPVIKENNISYHNHIFNPLGGIVNLNVEELKLMAFKHLFDDD